LLTYSLRDIPRTRASSLAARLVLAGVGTFKLPRLLIGLKPPVSFANLIAKSGPMGRTFFLPHKLTAAAYELLSRQPNLFSFVEAVGKFVCYCDVCFIEQEGCA